MAQITEILSTNARRRNILGQINDVERRLLEATRRSRELSLKRYIASLKHEQHDTYASKNPEMPDCTICLVGFAEADELVVFDCDVKHYFHAKCGADWLLVKTECPLCRYDFRQQI